MASSSRLILGLLFSLINFVIVRGDHQDDHNHDLLLRSLGSSMVLPLFLQTPNSSHQIETTSTFHRQLKMLENTHPNARMRLYDDLLANGYYTTRLWIGTPPQEFALIVDSGSTVTYVPCSTCEQCGKHQDPRFQPDLSSTYQPVKCSLDCSCNSEKTQCIYERQYAEMSSSSGVLGEDIVSFGNGSALSPQRAVFGCENEETGDLYSQRADGIMGLGRGQLSIMDQLADKGIIGDSFSLCYGGMDVGGGAMVLGGISPPSDMVFTHSDANRSPYYNIELKEIQVAGKALKLDSTIFDKKHGTVLDSGTTYAYLPEEAFLAFKEAMVANVTHLRQIRGPDPNYNDICFSGSSSEVSELSKTFPPVDMVFETGQKLSLSPENYLFRHSKYRGAYCLGIFQNGKDPTTLLGGIVVRNTLVNYDRENEKIGFFKTNCSALWNRANIIGPNDTANSTSSNSSISVPPTIAPSPSALPPTKNTISGKVEIGIITFDMTLSMKYSDLKPHINELTELISKELDVNNSQIHLSNFTSSGNETLMRCSIYPMGSASFISNVTAMKIIGHLEHGFELPATFGKYQLGEWKVEPPLERSWWDTHSSVILGVIATFVIVVVAGLLLGTWYVWRQRRQAALGTYSPVDAVVSEQELQKLSPGEV
ncbi:hypothetical protein ACHQM5_025101 [Ranunculus cassubicifolius]